MLVNDSQKPSPPLWSHEGERLGAGEHEWRVAIM